MRLLDFQVRRHRRGRILRGTGDLLPFSAETKQGRDEVWNLVDTEFLEKGTEE